MTSRTNRAGGRNAILWVITGVCLGAAMGWWLGGRGVLSLYPANLRAPAPHLIAQYPGGTVLQLAMVDDVLAERFIRHGRDFYDARSRERRAQMAAEDKQIAAGKKPSMQYLLHLDDISVGYDMTGRAEQAIGVMRRKRELMADIERRWRAERTANADTDGLTAAGNVELSDGYRALYRTFANLGTHLIHASFGRAMAGDSQQQARFAEGLELVQMAVEVNPQAHFGRENWQIVVAQYMLAASKSPQLLTEFDMVGNRRVAELSESAGVYRPGWTRWVLEKNDPAAALREIDAADQARREFREDFVTHIAADDGWSAAGTSLKRPAPFDEPVLAILGMWMLGGGANPHFAATLGSIMERVGQWELAWRAYYRATLTAERFSQDEKIRQQLLDHCQSKLAALEQHIAATTARTPDAVRRELQESFDRRLAEAVQYRQRLHNYERDQIAAGTPTDSPDFHDEFFRANGPPATKRPELDQVVLQLDAANRILNRLPAMLLLAGIGGIVLLVVGSR